MSNTMEYEQEQLLIDLIQHYQFLYDKSSKDYKDNNKKNNAWDSIALAMSVTVDEVQKMWKNLRERYGKERRILKDLPSGSGAPESSWPLFKYMAFMQKHVLSRKRVTNVSRPSSRSSETSIPSPLSSLSVTNIWNTYDQLTDEMDIVSEEDAQSEQATVPVATKIRAAVVEEEAIPGTSGLEKQTPRKSRNTTAQVEDTLVCVTNYLKDKQKPDKNMAFGQYVGFTLTEMPAQEQNLKKLKIVQILNETFSE